MMPKKIIRGTGITATEEVRYDLTDHASGDPQAFAAKFASSVETWNESISKFGEFRTVTEEMRAICEAVLQQGSDGAEVEDSPQDFARRILKYLSIADGQIMKGNAGSSARYALKAGLLWEQARIKWRWKRAAKIGDDFLKASRRGAGMHRGVVEAETCKVLKEMRLLCAEGKTVSSAARIVAKRGIGKSPDANRRAWHRHKKVDTHP